MTFATPIYHYAVSTAGGVCLDVLQNAWSPAVTLDAVLAQVLSLIEDPATADPTAQLSQRSWLSEKLRVEPTEYYAEAAAHTRLHACPLPADKAVEALGEDDWRALLRS